MKYSLQELFIGYKYVAKEYYWLYKITRAPKNIWRVIKLTYHWLKTGYSWHANWSLDSFIIDVLAARTASFAHMQKTIGRGYPANFEDEAEWQAILDNIAAKFKYLSDDDNDWIDEGYDVVYKEAMELLTEYLPGMWD